MRSPRPGASTVRPPRCSARSSSSPPRPVSGCSTAPPHASQSRRTWVRPDRSSPTASGSCPATASDSLAGPPPRTDAPQSHEPLSPSTDRGSCTSASVISYGATMTVTFFDWQRATFPPGVTPYNTLSPNLIAVRHELETRHGGTRLGGYSVRPVRNGTDPSSHGFGAAINHRIEPRERLLQAVDWLEYANHVRLGIQAIRGYVGCRSGTPTATPADQWRPGGGRSARTRRTGWGSRGRPTCTSRPTA